MHPEEKKSTFNLMYFYSFMQKQQVEGAMNAYWVWMFSGIVLGKASRGLDCNTFEIL